MPEPCHHLSTLYENRAFRVHLFRCGGTPVCSAQEEAANRDEYAFPLSGLYVRRCAGSVDVADATSVLFFARDEPYEIEHPIDGGDTTLIVQDMRNGAMADNFEFERGQPDFMPPDNPGSLRLDAIDWRRLVELSRRLSRPGKHDRLTIDEQLLTLVDNIRHRAWRGCFSVDRGNGRAENVRREIVGKAAVFMNRNYRDAISIDEISTSAGSSPYRLCRLFREKMGVTLHNYVVRLRLRESLELLRHSRKPLTEIALEVGFSSHSHFGEAFRKSYGQRPSEYRRRFQNSISLG